MNSGSSNGTLIRSGAIGVIRGSMLQLSSLPESQSKVRDSYLRAGFADSYKFMGYAKEFGEGIGLRKSGRYSERPQVHVLDCIAVKGEENDGSVWKKSSQDSRYFNTCHARHRKIKNDEAGLVLACQTDSVVAILGFDAGIKTI